MFCDKNGEISRIIWQFYFSLLNLKTAMYLIGNKNCLRIITLWLQRLKPIKIDPNTRVCVFCCCIFFLRFTKMSTKHRAGISAGSSEDWKLIVCPPPTPFQIALLSLEVQDFWWLTCLLSNLLQSQIFNMILPEFSFMFLSTIFIYFYMILQFNE